MGRRIVLDDDLQIRTVATGADSDAGRSFRPCDTVLHRILDQRLEQQRRNARLGDVVLEDHVQAQPWTTISSALPGASRIKAAMAFRVLNRKCGLIW